MVWGAIISAVGKAAKAAKAAKGAKGAIGKGGGGGSGVGPTGPDDIFPTGMQPIKKATLPNAGGNPLHYGTHKAMCGKKKTRTKARARKR
jgi:hypothetical protein